MCKKRKGFLTMLSTLKMCAMKLGASLLLVGTMATTVLGGQAAFAVDCGTTPLDSTGNVSASHVDCTTTFSATNTSGTLTLTAPTTVTATASNTTTHISPFSFDSTVVDDRSGTAGWNLQASSAGLDVTGTGSGNPVFPHFNATDTITGTTIDGGVCATPTRTAITLTSTPVEFVRAPVTTSAANCTYPITTSGTIDFSGHIAGLYSGDVTLTLLNTAAGS
jgi:hypothetical protein